MTTSDARALQPGKRDRLPRGILRGRLVPPREDGGRVSIPRTARVLRRTFFWIGQPGATLTDHAAWRRTARVGGSVSRPTSVRARSMVPAASRERSRS